MSLNVQKEDKLFIIFLNIILTIIAMFLAITKIFIIYSFILLFIVYLPIIYDTLKQVQNHVR